MPTSEDREVSVTAAAFSETAAELLRIVESGIRVVVERDGRPIAILSSAEGSERTRDDCVVHEAVATYRPEGVATSRADVPASALMRLIGTRATRAVLGVFVREPEREVHQREIARRAGVGLRSAQLALGRLESLGLVESRRDGNRRYYRASKEERFLELRRLLAREIGMPEVLLRHLSALAPAITWAFVYGSVASGDDRLDSDIDLMVVGDVTDDELVAPIAAAQRELGREIDVVVYRPQEFSKRVETANHFVCAAIAGKRIDLIGGPDDS